MKSERSPVREEERNANVAVGDPLVTRWRRGASTGQDGTEVMVLLGASQSHLPFNMVVRWDKVS